MGAWRRTWRAVAFVALVSAGARAAASVQTDPIARLSLEGGSDSNVLYNGAGGSNMGAVSPELGLRLRDHTWSAMLSGGTDILMYQQQTNSPVLNEHGVFSLRARPERRADVTLDLRAAYAPDPIGLARLGIFGVTGAAFIGNGKLRAAWRLDREWTVAGLFRDDVVRFDDGTGSAAHVPGFEALRQVAPRVQVGGVYRADFFQGFGPGAQWRYAQELSGSVRYQWTRHTSLRVDAGPALWLNTGDAAMILPQGAVELLTQGRRVDTRASLRHGVGLGYLATPGLYDSAEGAITLRSGRSLHFHVDGGLWRSGQIPWGANGVLGYGVEGEVGWHFSRGLVVALAASRFANLSGGSSQYDRNLVGLRIGWELAHP